jgi:hypothetical protein
MRQFANKLANGRGERLPTDLFDRIFHATCALQKVTENGIDQKVDLEVDILFHFLLAQLQSNAEDWACIEQCAREVRGQGCLHFSSAKRSRASQPLNMGLAANQTGF